MPVRHPLLSLLIGAPALVAALTLTTLSALADVTLPTLIADNMVLQRDTPVRIFGKADAGEKVHVSIQDRSADTTAGADGTWEVMLKPLKPGGPFTLNIAGKNTLTLNNVLVGEVWVASGQSNMEFALRNAANGPDAVRASDNPNIHLFHVAKARSNTPLDSVRASWQPCGPMTVPGFSAVAYFFGRDLQKALGVPIGLIESDWGGTPAESWTREGALAADPYLGKTYVATYPAAYDRYEKALAAFPDAEAKAKADNKPAPRKPAAPWRYSELYNAMIAPLVKYTIKGAIWYQGESNTGNPSGYRTLFPAMIRNWRDDWGIKDFPFLAVQLAPFGNGNPNGLNYAELREAQTHTTEVLPNVGVAVITDVGDQGNIHPTRKEPAGQRLALLARRIAYGEKIEAVGPTYRDMKADGNRITLRFDNVGEAGLTVRGGDASGATVPADKPVGFTIAGADGKFVPAEARITGKDTIEISSPDVSEPKAVRYGFINFPVVNLWGGNGLPTIPFRTDAPK